MDKKIIFKKLKEISIGDWLETAPNDGWDVWVITSLDELKDGVDNLVLFGAEVLFIIESTNITDPTHILNILIEFYNEELKNIK